MNDSITINKSKFLAPDRYLEACPIRYECRSLFMYLMEMEYCPETENIEILLNYPEKNDVRYFSDEQKLQVFITDVKKFAFPYMKITSEDNSNRFNSSLVQFYTFVLTDANRIRQYGFCRSAQNGKHILCIVSYLPWYNVFINILNKISNIINEKDTNALYNFLEALYEYELPEPGNYAQIFSHDGLDQIRFQCPDRRVLASIQENRNLLKFFAFFDLDKLIKIFTALILERSILVVSKDLENLTSCGLSFEHLIYPLEWLHTFVPIVPEHIDYHVFNQPFPFIYGVHTLIYNKLNKSQMDNCIILLLDERQILNCEKDHLPPKIEAYLTEKLNYFRKSDDTFFNSASKTYDFLHTGPLRPFLESVLMIIDDYRKYILFDEYKQEFKFDETIFFKMKNVLTESTAQRYQSNDNEFFHEFRVTQAFEEFCRDRCEYLNRERIYLAKSNPSSTSSSSMSNSSVSSANSTQFQKDFIDNLVEQFVSDRSKFSSKIDKKFQDFKNKAKEKSSNLKTNLIKTRNQLIKKSTSIDNELTSKFQKSTPIKHNPLTDMDKQREFSDVSSSSSSSSLSTPDDSIKPNEKPYTIDLSNDPDIKKYFDDNFIDSKIDGDLIDISDTIPSSNELTKMENKLDKIDNLFDNLLLDENDKMGVDSNPIINPINEDTSLKSILNEFDPFSDKPSEQAQSSQTKTFNQFSNFAPKPFQPSYFVKPSQNVSQQVTNLNTTNYTPYRQVQINPFGPTPFYSNPSQFNQIHGYRPVNFQPTKNSNLPLTQNQLNMNKLMNNSNSINRNEMVNNRNNLSFDDDFNPSLN